MGNRLTSLALTGALAVISGLGLYSCKSGSETTDTRNSIDSTFIRLEQKREARRAEVDSLKNIYNSLRTFDLGDTTVYASDCHNFVTVNAGNGGSLWRRQRNVVKASEVDIGEENLHRYAARSHKFTFPDVSYWMDLVSPSQEFNILIPSERVNQLNDAKEAHEKPYNIFHGGNTRGGIEIGSIDPSQSSPIEFSDFSNPFGKRYESARDSALKNEFF